MIDKVCANCPLNKSEQIDNEKIQELYYLKSNFLDLVKDKKIGQATEELTDWIKSNHYIYTTKDDNKTEMWIYEQGIYTPNGKSEIKKIMRNLLGNYYSAYYYNLIMNKLEPDTFIEIDEFFSNNYIKQVPVLNGILNLKTKELSPFDPKKIFFNKLPVKYDPEQDCPKIDKFLTEVLADAEDRNVFYELGGFCLWKEYNFEKAFMFIGEGRNGKDKSLELIKRLIGIQNCCSVPLSSLKSDSFIISEFFGKMANLAGDIDYKDLSETGTFKALTGRSLMSAQRKFLTPITFENYAKFVFACNKLPMVYDDSKGFWDRWVLLEFPYCFVTQEEIDNATDKSKLKLRDPNIIKKIATNEEMSGLLNKFLKGLDKLNKDKRFSSTNGSAEIKNIWIRKSNSFMAFCLDTLESDYDSYISKKRVRKLYTDYCKQYKIIPLSDYVIKKTLEELFGVIERSQNDGFGYSRGWEGIRLKEKQDIAPKQHHSERSLPPRESQKVCKSCNLEENYIGNDIEIKDKPPTNWIDMLIPINTQVPITTLIQAGITEKDINRSLSKGLIFEPKKGLISRL